MAEDAGVEEPFGELAVQPLETNTLGIWDGQRFYLRSFAVWYRWRVTPPPRSGKFERPESGDDNGVHFEQTMGRMVLWYDLADFGDVQEEDICVELSCWQLEVQVGKSLAEVKGRIAGGTKIAGLNGELFADIRLKLSWWEVQNDGVSRWLVIHLIKTEHRAWPGIWFTDCFNPHKKMSFPWQERQTAGTKKQDDEKIVRRASGPPQDLEKELSVGLLPERLCTGVDEEEDEYNAFVTVHLDEEAMEQASGYLPQEEIFSADVQAGSLEVYLRNEGLGVLYGSLKGQVEPHFSAWEIVNLRRTSLPKSSRIKCPAFYNPALRIKLVKAEGYQNIWGGVFAERQTAQFELPRERMSWTERVQRALVLSPAAPLKAAVKVEMALKLCTRVDASQDTVTQRVNLALHLESRLEELAYKFKIDLTTFFALKVADRVVDVGVVADCEFTMLVGRLGGAVEPDKTTWEIVREKDAIGSEKDHMVLKISLSKAAGSKDRWSEVFTRLEPWEVSELSRPPALESGDGGEAAAALAADADVAE